MQMRGILIPVQQKHRVLTSHREQEPTCTGGLVLKKECVTVLFYPPLFTLHFYPQDFTLHFLPSTLYPPLFTLHFFTLHFLPSTFQFLPSNFFTGIKSTEMIPPFLFLVNSFDIINYFHNFFHESTVHSRSDSLRKYERDFFKIISPLYI